jgi:hypothetical protein
MNTPARFAAVALASWACSGDPAPTAVDGAADVAPGSVAAALGGEICAVRDITKLCASTFADTANAGLTCDFVRAPCGGYSVWAERFSGGEVDVCVYDAQGGQIVDAVICDGSETLCSASTRCGGGPIAPSLPASCAIPPDESTCSNVRSIPPVTRG